MFDQNNGSQATKQSKTVEFRGGGFAPRSIRWVGFIVFVVLIALMEIGTQTVFIYNPTIPKPSDVFQTFVDLFNSGLLWEHLLPSMNRLAVGATLGVSSGIVISVLIVRKIVLPGAMPGILSDLRVSLAIVIILLVAAEMLRVEYGIGAYILEAGSLYDLERLFVGVTILSLLGVSVNAVISLIETRLLKWRL